MKTAKAPKVQEPKMSELKAQAYLLASQIAGRKIAKTKTVKSWTEGLDLRKKSSWVKAIEVLEEIIAKNVIPMVLAKKPAPVAVHAHISLVDDYDAALKGKESWGDDLDESAA